MKSFNRYNIFAYEAYYPEGGLNDLVYSTHSASEALKWITDNLRNREYNILHFPYNYHYPLKYEDISITRLVQLAEEEEYSEIPF